MIQPSASDTLGSTQGGCAPLQFCYKAEYGIENDQTIFDIGRWSENIRDWLSTRVIQQFIAVFWRRENTD